MNLLRNGLEVEGYETRGSPDVKQAMEEIEKDRPDLIILDIMLPKLDGTKLCWVLEKGEKHKSIPIIMMSAKKGEQVNKILKTVEADAFIPKPFESDRLLATIEELLKDPKSLNNRKRVTAIKPIFIGR